MSKRQKSSESKDTELPPAIRPSRETMDAFWEGASKHARGLPQPFSQRIRHQPAEAPVKQFPKYLMKIDGQRKFLTFSEAVVAYSSGTIEVQFGRYVLHQDFRAEKMTEADKTRISEAADRYEAGK